MPPKQINNMKSILLTATFILSSTIFLFSQTRTIKGKVFDLDTNEPLIGATLLLPNAQIIGVSDVNGQFEFPLEDSIDYLEVTYLAYASQRLYLVCKDCIQSIGLESIAFTTEVVVANVIQINRDATTFSTIENIPLDNININNGTNMLPLFNSLSGVYVHSGALNTNRMTIRGIGARSPFSTRNIKMYYNEIPITSGDGESLMEDLDISSFDKVYVVKGPSETAIGAPLGGGVVLNNYKWFSSSRFTSDIGIGSYGLWRNANKLQIRNKKSALQFFQNTTHSDGYRDNNNYDRQSIGMNGMYNLNKNNNLSFIAHYTQLTGEIPSSIDSATYENSPTSAAANWLATKGYEDYNRAVLGINHRYHRVNVLDEEYSVSTSLFSNIRNNYEVRPFNILQEDVGNIGLRSVFNANNQGLAPLSWKYQLGTEVLYESYGWQTYENEDNGTQAALLADNLETRQYANFFTQLDLTFSEKFSVTAGLNVNNTRYQLNDRFNVDSLNQSGNHVYDWIFSPKLGINYTLERFYLITMQLYANVSHGFSMPSVEETLLPDGLINADLQPEKGWNFEIGSKGKIFDGKIRYNLATYRMLINDLIVAERIDADSYVGVNAGKTQHDGLELSVQYEHHYLTSSIYISGNYSLNNYIFKDFINDGDDYSGNKMTGIPSNTANLNATWQGGKQFPLYLNVTYRYVGAIPIYDDNRIFSESYQLVNAKAGYQFLWKELTFDAYLGLNNLMNEKYASMIAINSVSFGGRAPRLYYPGLPRNVYAGVRLTYEF